MTPLTASNEFAGLVTAARCRATLCKATRGKAALGKASWKRQEKVPWQVRFHTSAPLPHLIRPGHQARNVLHQH
eukprot:317501-Chlamydomonas_euryale.AAC.2